MKKIVVLAVVALAGRISIRRTHYVGTTYGTGSITGGAISNDKERQ